MFANKIIFISSLDWGLGHATRCVPLIKDLMIRNTVILGVTKKTSLIFDEEFPSLQKVSIEPYNISYSKNIPVMLKLFFNIPRLLYVIKKEHRQLQKIISEFHVNVVISDNRLGLYASDIETVYMTHQLNIQAGWLSGLANKVHHYYIKKYHSVWVPDYKETSRALAGKLSRDPGLNNITYLGPLSRLNNEEAVTEKSIHYLCLLSGPEPQRYMLEEKLLGLASLSAKKTVIVRGTKTPPSVKWPDGMDRIDLPNSVELSQLIQSAHTIICRSGYSTLMDLHHFKKKNLILIATPGQPEQLYLAVYWSKKFGTTSVLQNELDMFKLD